MKRHVALLVVLLAACSNGAEPPLASSTAATTSTRVPTSVTVETTTTAVSTSSTSTTSGAVAADAPSQSPSDAARDGVVPEIAELTPQQRIQPLLTADAAEGTWVLSALTDAVINASMDDGCAIGDSTGRYGVDFVCSVEYGEIVLADERGEIARAFPMPGAKPSWIHLTESWVYAGRIGDGGLPDSTIVRINRADLFAVIVVLPAPFDGGSSWPPSWFVASPDQIEQFLPLVGQGGDFDGLLVESWIGPVVVDLEAIDVFVEQFLAAG